MSFGGVDAYHCWYPAPKYRCGIDKSHCGILFLFHMETDVLIHFEEKAIITDREKTERGTEKRDRVWRSGQILDEERARTGDTRKVGQESEVD